ncbi:MAG TPA: ferrous iron transport protein B [Methylomusa anaerophila]|uniref:Ferrous iron transport protein B n=1 Tax=Methylomusa anaerophila TaxID=1930071 RepID=A0A348AQC8_9FIRM|nr:ferrous iron transport protein B [Methylomusa anaerophila]BBB93276.1 ferrous iron transport protein B [Methylomusa anaerophila]HML86893.1 ferrous iron transport protein B [Methylomusa anaerophila]
MALVGSPNVGKSVIFNYLTGSYVTVSNYPGTTVDIARGFFKYGNVKYEVMDTPGIYSLLPITDEERVTRLLLAEEKPDAVIHVVDAKNLRRMLNLTIQLLEAGLPVILNLNIMDEAENLGLIIDAEQLARRLNIPVIPTSATKKNGSGSGSGMDDLKKAIVTYAYQQYSKLKYPEYPVDIEMVIDKITMRLRAEYGFTYRAVSLLLLQGDVILTKLIQRDGYWHEVSKEIRIARQLQKRLDYSIILARQKIVDIILENIINKVSSDINAIRRLGYRLERLTREPLTGIPILMLVLYFGLYQFVGRFGAGFLVDYINNTIFSEIISPVAGTIVTQYIEWDWLRSLLMGEYGVITLGFRYAIAIILPIVGTFFLAFSLLEDSGYLPRLAMLVDLVFKHIGLNGRAVIPLTLGLGCGTMAVVVTRTLETKRERLLASFLLALTIPCSAQLGVVLALLSHNVWTLIIWTLYMTMVFSFFGWLTNKIIPGSRSPFYMELPPLRVPVLINVFKKAYTRMSWYFMEILPVFVVTSLLMWVGDQYGLLSYIIDFMTPVMFLLGLPAEGAQAFILGFFRRDYGAAGLYNLAMTGRLNDAQLLTAATALTLFVPCVAQFAVIVKERGIIAAAGMATVIVFIAFVAAFIMHNFLNTFSLFA